MNQGAQKRNFWEKRTGLWPVDRRASPPLPLSALIWICIFFFSLNIRFCILCHDYLRFTENFCWTRPRVLWNQLRPSVSLSVTKVLILPVISFLRFFASSYSLMSLKRAKSNISSFVHGGDLILHIMIVWNSLHDLAMVWLMLCIINHA